MSDLLFSKKNIVLAGRKRFGGGVTLHIILKKATGCAGAEKRVIGEVPAGKGDKCSGNERRHFYQF